MNKNEHFKPFLKWAGGKTQLIPELVKLMPKRCVHYMEPFLGGGALFFYLKPHEAILSDSNKELINCYLVVRDNVESLINALSKYINNEEEYYRIRGINPETLNNISRAARFIYLNKTCFNGLYRVNQNGYFNVPYGKKKSVMICDRSRLRLACKALKNTKIISGDYRQILRKYAKKGDFVYLDPPYHPSGKYSDFKRYTKESFHKLDQIKLKKTILGLVHKGVYIILTNSNTEFIRKLYKGFNLRMITTKRNISSNSMTRKGQDLIITFNPGRDTE